MKKSIRIRIAAILVVTMLFTSIPLSVSAASMAKVSKPGKVTITSVKAGTTSSKTNMAKVTIKWKKVSKATSYQVYGKHYTGKWKKLGTVKKTKTSAVIKASAGYVSFKVRAVKKVKKKNYYGAYSKVKNLQIKSPMNIEKFCKFDPDTKKAILSAKTADTDISISGSTIKFTHHLEKIPESGINEDNYNSAEIKSALAEGIEEQKSAFTNIIKETKKSTGVTGTKVKVVYMYNTEEVYSRTFS